MTNPILANETNNYAVILIYHKFDEPKSPSTSISISEFEKQIKYLINNHYNIVSLDTLLEYISEGKIPPKTVSITIDDGYKSTMKAFKILKKYNLPFTLFLYMEAVARYPDFLTKRQLNILKKYPKITFGNHSYAHKHFAKVKKGFILEKYKKNFLNDTLKAEKRFKNLIGYKPKYYAYPYGEYNEIMVEVLKRLGYKAVFTQDPFSISSTTNRYLIPRQAIVGHWGNINHFINALKIEPLPVKSYSPPFGILKKNPPKIIKAAIEDRNRYKNCGIYVSELGWIKPLVKENTIFIQKLKPLKRWKNRIGFTCFDFKTKKPARFFYMIINPR